MRKYSRLDGVYWQEKAGLVLVTMPNKAKVWKLNSTGSLVWQAIGELISIDEIVGLLQQEFDKPNDVLSRDVRVFIDGAVSEGIVECRER